MAKVHQMLGLHLENDEDFATMLSAPGGLEVLCARHHRSRYGVHQMPSAAWEVCRAEVGVHPAAAEFVMADPDLVVAASTAAVVVRETARTLRTMIIERAHTERVRIAAQAQTKSKAPEKAKS